MATIDDRSMRPGFVGLSLFPMISPLRPQLMSQPLLVLVDTFQDTEPDGRACLRVSGAVGAGGLKLEHGSEAPVLGAVRASGLLPNETGDEVFYPGSRTR